MLLSYSLIFLTNILNIRQFHKKISFLNLYRNMKHKRLANQIMTHKTIENMNNCNQAI